MADAEQKKGTTSSKEIVARGRRVIVGDKTFEAGAVVELSTSEAKRLRELGFIVNPDAEKLPDIRGNGPVFSPASGPTIKRVA